MFRKINLELEEIGLAIVGFSSILHVQTQTWENSFQRENQMQHIIEPHVNRRKLQENWLEISESIGRNQEAASVRFKDEIAARPDDGWGYCCAGVRLIVVEPSN
jgi:hypothetical protein